MATYTSGIYGIPLYGERPATNYYDSRISAWAYDYETVFLKWGNIKSNPAFGQLQYWRLTRTNTGAPDNPFTGEYVIGGAIKDFVTSYTDYLSFTNTTQTVYSLWVFDGTAWISCGSTVVNILVDSNSLYKVTKWIPHAWLNASNGIGDVTGEPEPYDFETMLSGFVFEYDRLRGEIELLSKVSSTVYAPTQLLKNKIEELGFNYEPTLGDIYHRSLYNSGNLINADKGTVKSLSSFITALTHWDSQIEIGHNLMLNYNDSSFEENIGYWSTYLEGSEIGEGGEGSENVVFTQHLYEDNTTSGGELGVAIAPPSPNLYDPLYPPRALGFGVISTSATSTVSIWLPDEEEDPTTKGIPVKPNTRYIFTGWVKQLDATAANVTAKIYWYDRVGTQIGTSGVGPTTATSSTWKEFTSYCDSARNGIVSPLNAAYAGLRVYVTPAASTAARYAIDMFMLCEPSKSFEYQDARRVNINVTADLENYVLNSSFEQGVGFWKPSYNGSFAQDPTISPNSLVWPYFNPATYDPMDPNQYLYAHIGELTVFPKDGTNYDPAWITSDWVAVDPGQNYTFSGYISSDDTETTVIARIEFSNKISSDQQDHIFSDSNGQYFDSSTYYVDSQPFAFTGTHSIDPVSNLPYIIPRKTRFYVTAIAPEATPDSGQPLAKLSLYFPNIPANPPYQADRTFWFDGFLFQDAVATPILDDAGNPVLDLAGNPTAELNQYFDGSGGPVPSNPITTRFIGVEDCSWEVINRTNFIDNPTFDTLTGWTASSGITLSNASGPGGPAGPGANPNFPANWEGRRYIYADGSYGAIVTDPITGQPKLFYFPPKYGDNNLVVNYAPNFLTAGYPITVDGVTEFENPGAENIYSYIETTVYLPQPAVGGEDIVLSAYVRGSEGTYVLSAYTGDFATTLDKTSNHITVVQHDQYQWIRIYNIRQAKIGETSFTVRLSHQSAAAYPVPGKIPQSGFFVVDGFQAEYGRTPSAFIDPADSGTVVLPNPTHSATNIYLTQAQNAYGGKSNYHYNWASKASRLANNLSLVMPYGSTWAIKKGDIRPLYAGELVDSLIPSASFEKDLGSWSGVRSTLARKYATGSLFVDTVVQGSAYCEVTTSNTDPLGDISFGITTDFIPIKSDHGYYSSVAIKPSNAASTGVYTLKVDFYDSTALSVVAGGGTPTPLPAMERYTINSVQITSNRVNLDIGQNALPTGASIIIQGLPLSILNGTFTLVAPEFDQDPGVVSYLLGSPIAGGTYGPEPTSGILQYDVTSSLRSISQTLTRLDRWAYFGLVNPGSTTVGAAYAKLSVIYSPSGLDATQAFKIDKAVFRE